MNRKDDIKADIIPILEKLDRILLKIYHKRYSEEMEDIFVEISKFMEELKIKYNIKDEEFKPLYE